MANAGEGRTMSMDCIPCSLRRLGCDRTAPVCGVCKNEGTASCSYDWTLGNHIYDLFAANLNLNELVQLGTQESVHSTMTARIYQAEAGRHGLVAVKVLWERGATTRVLQLTLRESWTWSQLRHSNIVPLLGVANLAHIASGHPTQLCMISPWMPEGNIMDFLESHPNADRLRLLWDIARGVDYLHSHKPNKIVHGDLKGNNVLVELEGPIPRARLTDFGLSYAILQLSNPPHADSTSSAYGGNPRWLAIERLDPGMFGLANAYEAHSVWSDVFEMSRTFLQILTGTVPFPELTSDVAVINAVHRGETPKRPSVPVRQLDNWMWGMMERSWRPERQNRPLMSEVLGRLGEMVVHEALQSGDTNYIETLDIDYIVERLGAPLEASYDTTPLLQSLFVILEQSPARIFESERFPHLIFTMVSFVMDGSNSVPGHGVISLVLEATMALFAGLARLADPGGRHALIAMLRKHLPLVGIVKACIHLDGLKETSLRDILQLLCFEGEQAYDDNLLASMDETLQFISDSIHDGLLPSRVRSYWQEVVMFPPVKSRLLCALQHTADTAKPMSGTWPVMFRTIVDWLCLEDPTARQCLLPDIAGKQALSNFLSHPWEQVPARTLLDVAALIIEGRADQSLIGGEHCLRLLRCVLCDVLDAPESDELTTCSRLLSIPNFHTSLSHLMKQGSVMQQSSLKAFAQIIRLASTRLNYDPCDILFGILLELPWISLASSRIQNAYSSLQLEMLDSLVMGRSLIFPPVARSGPSLDEVDAVLPMVAYCLTAELNITSIAVCAKLFEMNSFKSRFKAIFTDGRSPDSVFNAAARIWLWSFSSTASSSQSDIAKGIVSCIPLKEQIALINSTPTLSKQRLHVLLRLLAYRVHCVTEHRAVEQATSELIVCISEHLSSPWVASCSVRDLVGLPRVLATCFSSLDFNKELYPRVQALHIIVAAYRASRGRNNGLNGRLLNRELPALSVLCSSLRQENAEIRARLWEYALYRLDLEPLSTKHLATLPLSEALDDVKTGEAEVSYLALLFLQHAFRRFGAQHDTLRRLLPSDLRSSLPSWLEEHVWKTRLPVLKIPLAPTAEDAIKTDIALVSDFRAWISGQGNLAPSPSPSSSVIHAQSLGSSQGSSTRISFDDSIPASIDQAPPDYEETQGHHLAPHPSMAPPAPPAPRQRRLPSWLPNLSK